MTKYPKHFVAYTKSQSMMQLIKSWNLVHTLLAKVDVESAFRLLSVYPADRSLLAMQLDNNIYIVCLPTI